MCVTSHTLTLYRPKTRKLHLYEPWEHKTPPFELPTRTKPGRRITDRSGAVAGGPAPGPSGPRTGHGVEPRGSRSWCPCPVSAVLDASRLDASMPVVSMRLWCCAPRGAVLDAPRRCVLCVPVVHAVLPCACCACAVGNVKLCVCAMWYRSRTCALTLPAVRVHWCLRDTRNAASAGRIRSEKASPSTGRGSGAVPTYIRSNASSGFRSIEQPQVVSRYAR